MSPLSRSTGPPLNALHSDAYAELFETFYELSKDDRIKVIVLTGRGDRAFVAGADVKEFLTLDKNTGPLYTRRNNAVREYIRQYPKPVICAVNGLAYGGGCALALVCDVRIAAERASFSLGEINMGSWARHSTWPRSPITGAPASLSTRATPSMPQRP